MKVLILSDINSPHTQKWAISLKKKEVIIGIFSLTSPDNNRVWNTTDIELFYLSKHNRKLKQRTSYSKISYLKYLPFLKKVIKFFKPDIIHAHYISSYGLLSVFTRFHPLVMSAWGSDVMEFPKKSFLHKIILQYILNNADIICATSNILKNEVLKYTIKESIVIPFGIDTDLFKPIHVKKNESFIIGTTKSLEKIYGIDTVIKSFAILYRKYSNKKIELIIIGDGTQYLYLKKLSLESGVENSIHFMGFRSVIEMPKLYNQMDVLVNVSINESFGVSVLEASSCEKCVIASNVGGLPEVVDNGETGCLVEPNSPDKLANILENILLQPDVYIAMGKKGRKKVINEYDLKKCTDKYMNLYKQLMSKKS